MHRQVPGCLTGLLVLAVAVLPLVPRAAPAAGVSATLELAPCRLEHPRGLASFEARCGRLAVPENTNDPGGRRIELAVAVVPAISRQARPDPLFLLAGGPGQGARDAFVPLLGALMGVRRDRDLVLVDQRGTGLSNAMTCDFPEEAWADEEVSAQQFRSMAEDCLAALPCDPRFFTTSVAVRDLDAVRAALGYESVNLYGGSYGTRVAQHYARRFPDHARSVLLDSVVHPTLALGASMALDAEAALRGSFARCAATPACAARYPRLGAQFDALRDRLAATPVDLTLADPVQATPTATRFTAGHFALAVRMLSYSDRTASLLPLLLDEAADRGNFAPLAAQAEMVRSELEQAIAYGMHNSVVCTEDLPFLDADAVDRDALRSSYLGETMLEGLDAMCSVWPRGVMDPGFKEPLDSAVPALLLAGSLDPVTPPSYAAAAAEGFRDSLLVVFEGKGHIQLGQPCAQRIVRHFLDAGTARGIDASCADEVEPAPFFLSFNGSAP
jgi:pimeloyl-ACP methyl ester carboxylesterase